MSWGFGVPSFGGSSAGGNPIITPELDLTAFNKAMSTAEKIKTKFKDEWCYIQENVSLYFHVAASVTSAILARLKQTSEVLVAGSVVNIALTGVSIASMQAEAVAAFAKGRFIQGGLLQALAVTQTINLAAGEAAKARATSLKNWTDSIQTYRSQYTV